MNSGDIYGKVIFVGGGPGSPDLITKRGQAALESCDAVVFDDLAPEELVILLPDTVEKFYVGKRGGRRSSVQSEINSLLIRLTKEGRRVVRLKGGDPALFSRMAEEIAALESEGIDYEVIPGITAAAAAAADLNQPLTDRASTSFLIIATGRSAESDAPGVPWERIAELTGWTVAVYMGVSELTALTQRLMSGGAKKDLPVVIVEQAGTGGAKVVETTLQDAAGDVVKDKVLSPAVILIGRSLATAERRIQARRIAPLVMVTRPTATAAAMCRMLRERGFRVRLRPTIKLTMSVNRAEWMRFKTAAPRGGWCVFTSQTGVDGFFCGLKTNGMDIRTLGAWRLAAVGEGTAAALKKYGLTADLMPSRSTVKDLAAALVRRIRPKDIVVRVRGNLSDEVIEISSHKKGCQVLPLNVYLNETVTWPRRWVEELHNDPPDYIAFTSGSTVEGFIQSIGDNLENLKFRRSVIAAIGPATAAVARRYNLESEIVPEIYNIGGLIDAIADHYKNSSARSAQ